MRFRILDANRDYIPDLKSKSLHLVGFTEIGLSHFRAYLEFAFDYNLDDAIRLCEKINHEDETGTIYPQGYLTGLPVRFFRSPLNQSNIDQFRSCLRDAFIANRDYCKSQEMVFHYACSISNRDEIIDETIQMANEHNDDPILKLVTIVADSTSAKTALQQTAFGTPDQIFWNLGLLTRCRTILHYWNWRLIRREWEHSQKPERGINIRRVDLFINKNREGAYGNQYTPASSYDRWQRYAISP